MRAIEVPMSEQEKKMADEMCGAVSREDGLRPGAVCVRPKGHTKYHGTEQNIWLGNGYFWYDDENAVPPAPQERLPERYVPTGGDPKDFCACGHHEMCHANYADMPRVCNQTGCPCRSYKPAATAPQAAEGVDGTWPAHCEQRAFVMGMKWWQFHANGSTAFPGEVDQAEAEAIRRYGDPLAARAVQKADAVPAALLDELQRELGTMRRLYLHLLTGNNLRPEDMSRLIEFTEDFISRARSVPASPDLASGRRLLDGCNASVPRFPPNRPTPAQWQDMNPQRRLLEEAKELSEDQYVEGLFLADFPEGEQALIRGIARRAFRAGRRLTASAPETLGMTGEGK